MNMHTSYNPATPLLPIRSGDGVRFREEAHTRSWLQPCVLQEKAENKPNAHLPTGKWRNICGADARGRTALALKRDELAGGDV